MLVAVVCCVQPDQEAQGAFVLHGPAVQPGQSDGGHALPPHQFVQGPLRMSERVDQPEYGPQLDDPHGPEPSGPTIPVSLVLESRDSA